MSSDSEATRDVLVRFDAAFAGHHPDDLDDLVGADCILDNTAPAPDGARYEGRAACLEFWKGLAAAPHLAFAAEEIWAHADRGVIRWRLRWGDAATDQVRGVNVMRVAGGKVVEALGYVKA